MIEHRIQVTKTLNELLGNYERSGVLTQEYIGQVMENIKEIRDEWNRSKTVEKPTEMISQIHDAVDVFTAKNIERFPQVTCRKGCAHCCHINVDIFRAEAELIWEFVNENNIAIDMELLERQSKLSMKERPLSKDSACAFLDENNFCKIYPARPTSCRQYIVINEPEKCDHKKYTSDDAIIRIAIEEVEIMTSGIYNTGHEMGNMAAMLLKRKLFYNERTTKDR